MRPGLFCKEKGRILEKYSIFNKILKVFQMFLTVGKLRNQALDDILY